MKTNDVREEFYTLMKARGFKSFREFARATGIEVSNIHSNLTGQFTLSIQRAFIIADTLKVPIDNVLSIFYPEEMRSNQDAVADIAVKY